MKHLPDLLTLQYRHPLFHSFVCLSIRPSQHLSQSLSFTSKYSNQLQFYNNHHTLHDTSPWPPDIDTFYVDVRYLLNYKAYNHQTLQSASSQCTDSAYTLTWWPWPIFWLQWLWHNLRQRSRSPRVRPLATKPCIVLLLDVLTRHVSWPGDLDLYFALQCLLHILCRRSISPQL